MLINWPGIMLINSSSRVPNLSLKPKIDARRVIVRSKKCKQASELGPIWRADIVIGLQSKIIQLISSEERGYCADQYVSLYIPTSIWWSWGTDQDTGRKWRPVIDGRPTDREKLS